MRVTVTTTDGVFAGPSFDRAIRDRYGSAIEVIPSTDGSEYGRIVYRGSTGPKLLADVLAVRVDMN
jgi:hypothetical protein